MNRRILIADDDIQILDYYRMLFGNDNSLESYGLSSGEMPFEIRTFTDGTYLADFFRYEYERLRRIPLCILDMQMKNMGGLETAKIVRNTDPEVIIIFITGQSDVSFSDLLKNLKDNVYYLSKPVRGEELLSQVTSLLNNWNHQQALKEAYREMDRTRRQLQDMLMYSPAITIQQDMKGRYILINRKFELVFGKDEVSVLGKQDSELFPPPIAQMISEHIREVIDSGEPKEFEEQIPDGDSLRTYISMRYPIFDEKGRMTGVGAKLLDITERKQAEEQLEKTYRELEQTKNMLVQSEKLAAVGQLAAGAAHEILNPTNIISIRLQLLSMTENLSERGKEAIEICKAQVQRIVQITRDLGQFTRLSEKQFNTSDLNKVMKHVLSLCAPQLKVEGIQIEGAFCPDIPPVVLDENRFEQVILNLISNAIAAIGTQKNRRIRISTAMSPSPGYVRIELSDTGTGIDPENLYRIFNPFYTTKAPGQGTGLGLFISYSIIQAHGGKIWAENNSWGGASFFIEIPVAQ